MCSYDPLRFRWSRGYMCTASSHHHQPVSIYLSNSCLIFRGCVPQVVVPSYSDCYFIPMPRKFFLLPPSSPWYALMITYITTLCSYLLVGTFHHLIIFIIQSFSCFAMFIWIDDNKNEWCNMTIPLLQTPKLHVQRSIQWKESHRCHSIQNAFNWGKHSHSKT